MRIPYKGAGIALIYSDSEDYILLGRRSDYPFHNRWSVPGGYYEKTKDIDLFSNAVREFNEETGFEFKPDFFNSIGKMTLSFPLFNWTTFICPVNEKVEGFTPNEFFEIRWVRIKDLNKYRLRPFTKAEVRTFYRARH